VSAPVHGRLVAELREAVAAGGLLAPGREVLVMFSGGRDSSCLLDVVLALCGAQRTSALHVNYGLRAAADGDERHCARVCEELGVTLEIVRAPSRGAAAGNVQSWARTLRYEAAEQLAARGDALIATGHTASDQVETILYRLAASPGRRALLGMPAAEGRLVRPLLAITRAQTGAYCEQRRIAWREDESNADERYARARVRHGLLPALRAVHPAAEANVLRSAALLREETELLEGLVAAELAGEQRIAIARLAALPRALARAIVVRLAEHASGTYVPRAGERVEELLALAARGGSAELHVGAMACAVIEDGALRMRRLAPHERSGGARQPGDGPGSGSRRDEHGEHF
jgi:tRNA(Ile)-lysidine synthase